jgi:hypothetical protein
MSQQRTLIQSPLVGAILLCLLAGVYLVIWKLFSKPEETPISKHSVETKPEDALKYWTKGRMRKAKPAKMPHVDTLDPEPKQAQHPPV